MARYSNGVPLDTWIIWLTSMSHNTPLLRSYQEMLGRCFLVKKLGWKIFGGKTLKFWFIIVFFMVFKYSDLGFLRFQHSFFFMVYSCLGEFGLDLNTKYNDEQLLNLSYKKTLYFHSQKEKPKIFISEKKKKRKTEVCDRWIYEKNPISAKSKKRVLIMLTTKNNFIESYLITNCMEYYKMKKLCLKLLTKISVK